ncbi:MAG TPA: DUF4124 domain-containing protein [Nevskiaceae bacterium]|nr:DUF4124 domain-containing protein [Nevskiaceae bacterium]
MRQIAALLLLTAAATAVAADSKPADGSDKVYRYTDDNGVVHYTDKPPSKDARPVDLPPLQTYRFKKPPRTAQAPPPPPAAPTFELAITSPTPDQTLRSGTDIAVSVSVMPGLLDGYGLIYSLDGAAQTADAIPDTSYTLKGANRGDHTVTVSLVSPDKQELTSTSITVHMLPPTVNKP